VDLSKGEIEGHVAISLWAVRGIGGEELLDLSEYEVRLVPAADLDTVLTRPAGEWFTLPDGKYKFWLEGPGWITPYSSVLDYKKEPFRGKGIAGVVPVVPAGIAALDAEITPPHSAILRLLHLDSHRRTSTPQRELSRSVPEADMREGVLMPEGEVVAALVDYRTKDYLALSRPVRIERESRVGVYPSKPQGPDTDLLVRLERPVPLADYEHDDLKLSARSSSGGLAEPEVYVSTVDRVYAIWYGLREKQVTLEASSATVFLSPEQIVLRPGKVESYRGFLRSLPDVEVQLDLPPSLSESDALELEVVLDRPSRDLERRVRLPSGTRSFWLKHVAAQPVDIVLHAPPWTFHRPIDLSDGADATVHFEPVPIAVTGTVYRGDQGHPAVVEFQTNRSGDVLRVATDESGAYRAELFRAGYYAVNVFVDGADGAPSHVELLDRPIREDATLDFRLPDNRFVVRVVDAETREGIPGAKVIVGNTFSLEEGPYRDSAVEKRSVLGGVTNRAGVSRLRPLHRGELTVRASAEGYLPSDLLEYRVEPDERAHEFVVALQRISDTLEVHFLLHDGLLPAAHAEVRLQTALGNTVPLWSGTADAEGLLELPGDLPETFALVRHPAAGSSIRRLLPGSAPDTWTLATAAPPLSVEVTHPWGDPARWAQLAVWIGDACVTGPTLAWFAGTTPAADEAGFWQARNLPASSLRILAWSSGRDLEARALEPLAVNVSYPWRAVLEIEAVE
jgi:hypothetical protein